MNTIRITDLSGKHAKTESFLKNSLCVISRSGLHATESLLIEHLPHLGDVTGPILVAGNRTAACAMAAALRFPESPLTCHTFDIHHARAILRNLASNPFTGTLVHDPHVRVPKTLTASFPRQAAGQPCRVACTTTIPPGPYSAALFMATPGTMTSELVLDQLEDIHQNLAAGAPCLIACEADGGPLHKQLKAIFGNLSVLHDRKKLFCAVARKKDPLDRSRSFRATFPASLPNSGEITLCSLPGVFCHRRPDTGGLALAEVAAQDAVSPSSILDMGCGCGLVGILLATQHPHAHITFIDSHTRALEATRQNLEALGITHAELILSDQGPSKTGFDLFVGNPPYYSEFLITELFLDIAKEALRPGGTCLTVAKNPRGLYTRQHERFGNAEQISRRGYGVVKSIR